jgi:hypothetical protein
MKAIKLRANEVCLYDNHQFSQLNFQNRCRVSDSLVCSNNHLDKRSLRRDT